MLERVPTRWSALVAMLLGLCPIIVMLVYIDANTMAHIPWMLPRFAPDVLLFATIFSSIAMFLVSTRGSANGVSIHILVTSAAFPCAVGAVLSGFTILLANEHYGARAIGPALLSSAIALSISAMIGARTGRRVREFQDSGLAGKNTARRAVPYGMLILLSTCGFVIVIAVSTDLLIAVRHYVRSTFGITGDTAVAAVLASTLLAFGGKGMIGTPNFAARVPFYVVVSAVITGFIWAPFAYKLFRDWGCRPQTHYETYFLSMLVVSLVYPAAACCVHGAIWHSWVFKGFCRHCRYDMHGLPSARCPECGWERGGE